MKSPHVFTVLDADEEAKRLSRARETHTFASNSSPARCGPVIPPSAAVSNKGRPRDEPEFDLPKATLYADRSRWVRGNNSALELYAEAADARSR